MYLRFSPLKGNKRALMYPIMSDVGWKHSANKVLILMKCWAFTCTKCFIVVSYLLQCSHNESLLVMKCLIYHCVKKADCHMSKLNKLMLVKCQHVLINNLMLPVVVLVLFWSVLVFILCSLVSFMSVHCYRISCVVQSLRNTHVVINSTNVCYQQSVTHDSIINHESAENQL